MEHKKTFILCFGNSLIWKLVLLGSGLGMTQCSLKLVWIGKEMPAA